MMGCEMSSDQITVSTFDYHFPPALRKRFWERVEMCLTEIFRRPKDLAGDLQHGIENLSIGEQMLFFHDDSLKVAARLAGIKLNSEHLLMYQELLALRRQEISPDE